MRIFLMLLFLIPLCIFGQYAPKIDKYQHKTITTNADTIYYHIYSNGNLKDKNKIMLFFQGSGGYPLFRQSIKIDTLKTIEDGEVKIKIQKYRVVQSNVPFDLDKIPNDYVFVIISKKGVPFSSDDKDYLPNSIFYENESLDYRVWQGDQVIKDIIKKMIKKPSKVVIIGHSEGADVVAKLGHKNKHVTHIGYWAGGGNSQYYDFALFIQKEVQAGYISQLDASTRLDSLFSNIKSIEKDPTNIKKFWLGNSYRRWANFSEPSIDNLLKIDKPLFVAVAGKDESVPIEASLLIPIEFIRHKKDNLVFKIYPDYNHSFAIPPHNNNEKGKQCFMDVFEEFVKFVEQ